MGAKEVLIPIFVVPVGLFVIYQIWQWVNRALILLLLSLSVPIASLILPLFFQSLSNEVIAR